MDPINPWLDPAEVRRLAERLMRPVRDPALHCGDAGFGDAFVGFAGPKPQGQPTAARTAPDTPPPPLSAAAAPPPSAPPPAAPPIEVRPPAPHPAEIPARPVSSVPATDHEVKRLQPAAVIPGGPSRAQELSSLRGPFLDRIHRFRDWMEHHFHSTGLFILDRDGAVIYDAGNHGRLHFLARSLALASRRQGASGGNVHVKIGAGATLEVIPVDTPYGCLVLGAVVPEALQPSAVAAVMDALSQVAAPPSHQ